MRDLKRKLHDLWANEKAASMVEYIFILSLVAMVILVAFNTIGDIVSDDANGVESKVIGAMESH